MFLPGQSVLVSDPKHSDSTHSHEFQGIIKTRVADLFVVEDMDGNCFTVEMDELSLLNWKADERMTKLS